MFKLNNKGFSVILVVVIIAFTAITSLVIWRLKSTAQPSVSSTNSTNQNENKITETKDDPTVDWKSYCMDFCFKFPANWSLDVTEQNLPDQLSYAVISNNDTGINVIPEVNGVGGVCLPNNCFFETLSITDIKDSSLGLKIVKGIFYSPNSIRPSYFVSDQELINSKGLVINEKTDVGYFGYFFKNINDPTKTSTFSLFFENKTFDRDSSLSWFSTEEAQTVGNILGSLTKGSNL